MIDYVETIYLLEYKFYFYQTSLGNPSGGVSLNESTVLRIEKYK